MNWLSTESPQATAIALLRADELSPALSDDLNGLLRAMLEVAEAADGTIWQNRNGRLLPLLQVGTEIGSGGFDEKSQQSMVACVLESKAPLLEFDGDSGVSLLLIPLYRNDSLNVVTIEKHAVPEVAEIYLARCALVAERLRSVLSSRNERNSLRAFRRAASAHEIVSAVGRDLDLDSTAYETVNRLQQYFNADRVSLAIRWPGGSRVHAISHQPTFDQRSNVVKAIATLASQTCGQKIKVQYPAPEPLAPELEARLGELCEASNAKSVVTLPLSLTHVESTFDTNSTSRACIGAIVVEGISSPLDQGRILRRWSRVELGVSSAISNAREHRLLRLLPMRRILSSLNGIGRWRKAVATLMAGMAVSLCFVVGDFRVRAEGVIQPAVMQHLYATQPGTVERLMVSDGDSVVAGQMLAELGNADLSARIAKSTGDIAETETQLRNAILRRITRQFSTPQEERELVRTTTTLESRLTGLQEEAEILRRAFGDMHVSSPVAGQVITWDVQKRLRDRPVKPGQRLLTVAQLDNGWDGRTRRSRPTRRACSTNARQKP